MTVISRRSFLHGSMTLTAAGMLGARTASAETMALRYNRYLPSSHHVDVRVFGPWFDRVREATEGRVDIRFTASSLAPLPRQYEIVAAGIADLSYGSDALTPGRFPLADMMEIPFLGESTYGNSVAYWRVYEKHFAPTNPYPDVKLLTVSTLPSYSIFTVDKAVHSIEDMRGLKLRVTGATLTDQVNSLGASAVPVQITEIHEALTRGVVDGMIGNDDQMLSFGVIDKFKYKINIPGGLASLPMFFIMGRSRWDSFSDRDKAAIEELAGEALAADIGRSFDQSTSEAQDRFSASGGEVIEVDEQFLGHIRERSAFIEENWFGKAEAKGVDGRQAVSELREIARSLG